MTSKFWPKSAIVKMGQKGLSQGPIDGAFFCHSEHIP